MKYILFFEMIDSSMLVEFQNKTSPYKIISQAFDVVNKTLRVIVLHQGDPTLMHQFRLLHTKKTDKTHRKRFHMFLSYENHANTMKEEMEHTLIIPLERIFSTRVVEEILKNESSCVVLKLEHMIDDSYKLYSDEVFTSININTTILLYKTE